MTQIVAFLAKTDELTALGCVNILVLRRRLSFYEHSLIRIVFGHPMSEGRENLK